MPSRADRVRGCIIGGAVGDALGAPVEFMTFSQIRRDFGIAGIAGYEEAYGRAGAFTDDTQMTLWTMEGLIGDDNRYRDRGICSMPGVVYNAYLRWLVTQEGNGAVDSRAHEFLFNGWLLDQSVMHHRRAPGNTCLSALRGGRCGAGEFAQNDSKGCGGVMRVARWVGVRRSVSR
jgi:ADP-ribosyl-[dinitrogen reductase] hydrolase